MNKVYLPATLNILTVLLFGWVLVELYGAQMQFAEVVKNPKPPWEITMNALPFFLFFLICTPIAIYLLVKGKRKHKKLWKVFMLPPEFEESDERERMITAKACRTAYITMVFTTPIAAALLLFYPMIQDTVPYYPVLIVLLLVVIQILSYFYSFHKNSS